MKTGLFLTPGAARTAYEAGAVHTLVTEGGIDFDVIGTCSAGAINGSFVATGQVDELVEQWSSWRDRDILGVDFAGLLRGAVLWAPSVMHNRPQRRGIIDRFIADKPIGEGVRFRTNLANLTTGRSDVFEWPGSHVPLAEGVDAAVAVPALVRPKVIDGSQYADGLTIDGCPLEDVLLCTGVDRAFVVGVAPQAARPEVPKGPLAVALAAAEWNQYSETTRRWPTPRASMTAPNVGATPTPAPASRCWRRRRRESSVIGCWQRSTPPSNATTAGGAARSRSSRSCRTTTPRCSSDRSARNDRAS